MSGHDGGPAFPTIDAKKFESIMRQAFVAMAAGDEESARAIVARYADIMVSGLSIRDYFAAQALSAIIAEEKDHIWSSEGVAETAYQVADAMLKERG